jgi:hypothetical protein
MNFPVQLCLGRCAFGRSKAPSSASVDHSTRYTSKEYSVTEQGFMLLQPRVAANQLLGCELLYRFHWAGAGRTSSILASYSLLKTSGCATSSLACLLIYFSFSCPSADNTRLLMRSMALQLTTIQQNVQFPNNSAGQN